jgi:hypothetical protein
MTGKADLLQIREELFERSFVVGARCITGCKHLFTELLIDLVENSFQGCKPPAQRSVFKCELDLWNA